ncbi:hypothetical protein FOZ63_003772 [Perkinsus olseni]|uniref:Uncharacterized protein n=1 Tax=Perkinsus olseni TaxID=32597 RepID=A0A7J6QFA6_PEROL|nr:hypothetical protein FOZ63_003772 [Perkinsus olseni]
MSGTFITVIIIAINFNCVYYVLQFYHQNVGVSVAFRMTIFNHDNSNASGYQATSVAGTAGWLQNGSDEKRYGSESTIGVPRRVQLAVKKVRDGITAEALEQRQRTAMRQQGGVPAHRAERESSVERTRQHLLDKTLPLGIRSVGSSLLGSTHPWRRHEDTTLGVARTHMKIHPTITRCASYSFGRADRSLLQSKEEETGSLRCRNRAAPAPSEYFASFPPSGADDAFGPQAKLQWRDALSSSTNPCGFDSTKVPSSAKFSFPRTRSSSSLQMVEAPVPLLHLPSRALNESRLRQTSAGGKRAKRVGQYLLDQLSQSTLLCCPVAATAPKRISPTYSAVFAVYMLGEME